MLVGIVMNTTRTGALSLSLLAAGFLSACDHTDRRDAVAPGTNVVEGTQVGATNGQASAADAEIVQELAAARCDRERSCNNVGGGQKYASANVCMEQMRGSIANDLNTYNCPRGIDRAEVDHCVAAIKNEECSHPLDTITRMEKCRTARMCVK